MEEFLSFLSQNIYSMNAFLLKHLFFYSLSIFKSLFFIYPFNIVIIISILIFSCKTILSRKHKESIKIQINFEKEKKQLLIIIELKEEIYQLKEELFNKFINLKQNTSRGLQKEIKKMEKQLQKIQTEFLELQKCVDKQFEESLGPGMIQCYNFEYQIRSLQEEINCTKIVEFLKKEKSY